MDITPYIPIIVEATKFFFNEAGKIIEQARKYSKTKSKENNNGQGLGTLSKQDLLKLEQKPKDIQAIVNPQITEANILTVKSLMEQLEIHIKNFNHLETVKAQYGLLAPIHVINEIENESSQIVEKSKKLQNLLSNIYGKTIEDI